MPKFTYDQPVLITNRAKPLRATIVKQCARRKEYWWVELENGEVKQVREKHLKAVEHG